MAKVFVAPFVLYLLGTNLIGRFPDSWYPLAYAVVVGVVAIAFGYLARHHRIIEPHWRIGPAIGVGLVGIAIWIGLSELHLEQQLAQFLPGWLAPGERTSYNPFEKLDGPVAVWAFIAVRTLGLAVVVPIAEELFWRGFLLRWLIDPEWEKVSLGDYTFSSFALVTVMFTLAHPEWLAAAIYCALLNALLIWKKDLWLCVVAHGVSNLTLVIYVLAYGAWWLW